MWGYGVIALVWNVMWGVATQKVIENKGYDENWFWWGFFFGVFALIAACTKPQYVKPYTSASGGFCSGGAGTHAERILKEGGWKCSCGKVHAAYVSSCSCGKSRSEVLRARQEWEREQAEAAEDRRKAAAIKEYKALADAGVITQEEFEAKKKQLLGI